MVARKKTATRKAPGSRKSVAKKTARKKSSGRPPVPIDVDTLKALARIHCSVEEIAAFMNLSERTIYRRFKDEPELKEAFASGRLVGNVSIRRKLFELIDNDSVPTTIFMAKAQLKMSDRPELERIPIGDSESFEPVFDVAPSDEFTKYTEGSD